ncbi:MAG: gliding motility-associated C-terminal domain-containing protein [Bacteroidota bacterium]
MLVSFFALSSNPDSLVNAWQKKNLQKVAFIENAGQFKTIDGRADPNSLFKVEVQGLTIYVTTKGLTYFFVKPKSISKSELNLNSVSKDSLEYDYHRFDIDLRNAFIKKESIIKEGGSGIDYNYFYPHCKSGIMGVREYEKLTIQNVYPGIDWILYSSNEKGLKYDFIVHPGANPQQISFLYKSLNPLQLKKDGTISLNTSLGHFIDSAPECFLKLSGSKINSHYILNNITKKINSNFMSYETEIGFHIDSYSKNETLIIDPLQLWWGTYYGGTHLGEGVSVTTDSIGNLFVLGNTAAVDIPLQSYDSLSYFQGTYGGANGGGHGDMFILKFTNAGKLLWATYFGGGQIETGKKIKCDKTGDFFILAQTASVNLPLKDAGGGGYFDTINGTSNWDDDLFLGKFSNSGQYLWGTYYGGDTKEIPQAIGIDIYNNVYFTGLTRSTNFPLFNPGGGALFQSSFNYNNVNASEGVILKFSNSGNRILSTFFGGDGQDEGMSIDCDHLGNTYVGGRTTSSNMFTLNPGGSAFFQGTLTTGSGSYSSFILKLNANCQPIWSTYISGIMGGGGLSSIVCDRSGNLFMTGNFRVGFPTVNPGGGAYFVAANPMTDIIISKFNTNGQMVWATYVGTWGAFGMSSLTLGSCEEIYLSIIAQSYCSTCPPMPVKNPGNGAYYDSTFCADLSTSNPDMFISAFSNSGALKWGTYFGGAGNEMTMELTCDNKGNLFYTGQQGMYNYSTPALLLTYSSKCIKNPGGGAFFQGAPSNVLSPFAASYCVIGKFTNPYTSINLSTTGCSNNDTIVAQPYSGWAPYTYNWSNGATTNSVTNIPSGSYTCTITDSFLGCVQEQQIYFGYPTIVVSSLNDSICLNQSTILEAQGADTYSWSPSLSLNASAGNTITASPQTATVYSVTGTTNSNCSSSNTVSVFVHSLPVVSVSGNDSICKGLNTLLNATGAISYDWIPNTGLGSSTGSNVVAGPDQTLSYTVIGTDSHNCIDSVSYTLKIIPLPQLQVTGPSSLCAGDIITLVANGADQFHWNLGSTQFNFANVVITPIANINYTLSGTNSGICKDSLSVPIHVYQLPSLSIQAIDSVCEGEEFLMQVFGNGAFNWQPSAGLSCKSCSSPSATLEVNTQYVVTITDVNSCSNKDSILIVLKEGCGDDILIPNIFSPDSDQSNDLFKIKANNIKAFECEIYDRWGLKLFHSNDTDFSWNGIVPNGAKAPEGVYFYLVKITKFNDQSKVYKGHLTLVR